MAAFNQEAFLKLPEEGEGREGKGGGGGNSAFSLATLHQRDLYRRNPSNLPDRLQDADHGQGNQLSPLILQEKP